MEKDSDSKSITVYPSTEMHIVCPHCGVKGKITKANPPEKAFAISCPKCKKHIVINLNKRKSYRRNIEIEASYQITGINRPPRKGNIIDISIGGLRFKCLKSIHEKIGNVMSLSFVLPPREEPIKVYGEIVRITEETKTTVTMGLRFKDLGEYEEMEIGFFLKA
ncbi:MAG: PilZ domain-containing protein [Nitrospirae bacterium]|nr:PilZ domain-containing protein [Nitrospirota bacterium]